MDSVGTDSGYPEFIEVRTLRPSEVPTIPVPRQERSETEQLLLSEYRRESARLTRLGATLKEMGIDPEEAWGPRGTYSDEEDAT